MTGNDYTPARLRELAERQQTFADRMDTWASDSDMADETAATLRAAAHELELAKETAREGAKERLEADAHYRATLAAREALLRRALPIVEEAARTAEFTHDAEMFRALAAEIAAALKETDNG